MSSRNLCSGSVLLLVMIVWLGNSIEAKSYNQSCVEYNTDCGYYSNLQCDPKTLRCLCQDYDVFDESEQRCRYPYCFERCLAPGYECKRGQCQQCWTQDNRYICDRPEEIYIPVAIAVGCTFASLVSIWMLVKVGCFLRRKNRVFVDYLVSKSKMPPAKDGLLQSESEVGQSNGPQLKIEDIQDGAKRSATSSDC